MGSYGRDATCGHSVITTLLMVTTNNTTEARTSTPACIRSSQNLVVHVAELLHARRGGGRTRNPRVAAVNLSGELVAVNKPRDVVGVRFVDLVAHWLRSGHVAADVGVR